MYYVTFTAHACTCLPRRSTGRIVLSQQELEICTPQALCSRNSGEIREGSPRYELLAQKFDTVLLGKKLEAE